MKKRAMAYKQLLALTSGSINMPYDAPKVANAAANAPRVAGAGLIPYAHVDIGAAAAHVKAVSVRFYFGAAGLMVNGSPYRRGSLAFTTMTESTKLEIAQNFTHIS